MTIDALIMESLLAKDMNKSFVVFAQSRRGFVRRNLCVLASLREHQKILL